MQRKERKGGRKEMGKNRTAISCNNCGDGLCYYGTTTCLDCIMQEGEIEFEMLYEEYQIARVEGFIPANMEFDEWLVKKNEQENNDTSA